LYRGEGNRDCNRVEIIGIVTEVREIGIATEGRGKRYCNIIGEGKRDCNTGPG